MKTVISCVMLLVLIPVLRAQDGYDQVFQETVRRNQAFKIEACKLAETEASLQEIKDYAAAELKAHPETAETKADAAFWRTKLDDLGSLSGPEFDHSFVTDMIFDDLSDKGSSTLEMNSGRDETWKSVAQKTKIAAQADLQAVSLLNSKLLSLKQN